MDITKEDKTYCFEVFYVILTALEFELNVVD